MTKHIPMARAWRWGASLTALGVAALLAMKPVVAEPDPVAGLAPLADTDFLGNGAFPPDQVELGRLLFFDKILSGNRNISCATCHHPDHAGGDGVALGIGEGGTGLGPARRVDPATPILGRVPRNAPALAFVGHRSFTRLFHDGRVEADPDGPFASGFWTPAREQLPQGLDSVLAAQAMFPVLSDVEMAGARGENPVADAAALRRFAGKGGAWDLLARRLRAIPGYVALFEAAYPDVLGAEDITFVHAANAIAAFEATVFRPDDSPFDSYLRTRDKQHLAPAAQRGMALFYGAAGCAACHAGPLQTDQGFHAIAMPQIGPGKGDGQDRSYFEATGYPARLEDFGRAPISGDPADRYRFRTPSLRNVALTGPWGHAGAYARLEDVVRHHLDPVPAVEAYRLAPGHLPAIAAIAQPMAEGARFGHEPVNPARRADHARRDGWVQESPALRARLAAANERATTPLEDHEVADILAFLEALTDPRSRDMQHLVPARVPSGLPVAD
ncbi:MAG: cytochrome c peroxidase [Pseudomonadota bacterium]